ncbi:MAG: type II toxin-antitoxin system VapC family toxin [Dehalococcoidia bacterium]
MSLTTVDASVVVKVFFAEPESDRAIALFRDAEAQGDQLIAPPLLPVEITNVVRKRMLRDRLSHVQATAVLEAFFAQPISLLDLPGLHYRALDLSVAHMLSTHDAHYVALAEMLGTDLWVGDGRLLRAAQGRLPFIRWIGD